MISPSVGQASGPPESGTRLGRPTCRRVMGLAAVCVVALGLLIAALAADGLLGQVPWRDLAVLLIYPCMTVHLIVASWVLARLGREVVAFLEPSWRRERLRGTCPRLSRRVWVMILLASVSVDVLLEGLLPGTHGWLWRYGLVTGLVMYGLGFWQAALAFDTCRRMRRRLHDLERWSIMDRMELLPVGRWALGVTLSLIGGEGIALLLLPARALVAGAGLIVSIGVSLPAGLYWCLMYSPHSLLKDSRENRRRRARLGIARCSHSLARMSERDRPKRASRLAGVLESWVVYDQWLARQSPWPGSLAQTAVYASALFWMILLLLVRLLAR